MPTADSGITGRHIHAELTAFLEQLQGETVQLLRDGSADLAAGRVTRQALTAVLRVLDDHTADAHGQCRSCRRRQACPAAELRQAYIDEWLATGGLAQRVEGDPDRVSTRRQK
ncbi:hypothetical protein [Kineosporia sp. NBRC 101731]|uniref:hypothetical protein n=1 Tax=Kineosporia sp. NBRC 101731 TaxID=3032199 RepID=UPI0024A196A9|nr:hypothetical protein [Kineosporia sp. NBRC 101731]GLY29084.1 hypothetical protein Kisp02_24490 [Kineosporia sp. NBRC 101731]